MGVAVVADAARNHVSWFGRSRVRRELDGVTLFTGPADAILAFPEGDADLAGAVAVARDLGSREVSCWSVQPDDELGERLAALGFGDGWQPHWMGIEPLDVPATPPVEEATDCNRDLPYWSELHERVVDGVHHLVVRDETAIVGHTILNVDESCGGLYDMGVLPSARRRGHGRALTLAALARARELGCSNVTLNATYEGELLYRSVGFRSLGHGMTWWLFPAKR